MRNKLLIIFISALFFLSGMQAQEKTVVIRTNVGTLKARLYPDVPNHTQTFITRAANGEFNGTLFTRVIKEFMIQGGAPDSKNAPPGARCGFGDPKSEIPPELKAHYFHKKGPWLLPARMMM